MNRTLSDEKIWEEDTKYDLADITNNHVAVKNDEVVMPKERENLKRIREEISDFDLVDVMDEVKMKTVGEEMEERPHKRQKLVSCL